jgi:hypothetical protein
MDEIAMHIFVSRDSTSTLGSIEWDGNREPLKVPVCCLALSTYYIYFPSLGLGQCFDAAAPAAATSMITPNLLSTGALTQDKTSTTK